MRIQSWRSVMLSARWRARLKPTAPSGPFGLCQRHHDREENRLAGPAAAARSARGTWTGVFRANTSTANVARSPSMAAIVPALPSKGPLDDDGFVSHVQRIWHLPIVRPPRDSARTLWHHDVVVGEGGGQPCAERRSWACCLWPLALRRGRRGPTGLWVPGCRLDAGVDHDDDLRRHRSAHSAMGRDAGASHLGRWSRASGTRRSRDRPRKPGRGRTR